MVSVILTDATHKDIAAIDDSTLDLAFGSDENNFEFSFIDTCDAATRFTAGSFCYIDGTEYGGVVDSITTMKTHDGTALTYTGRSWHGVLAEQVLQPDAGADYLIVNGTAQQVLQSCFDRIHLNNLFIADSNTTSIRYQFDRYTNAWNGIRKMLRASSMKLVLEYRDGQVHATATPIASYSDLLDSDLMDFTATRNWRPVNHLIGLGTGELRNRVVSHWYADSAGKVSQTQTLTGIDEVCEVYDYSNATADELAKATQEKLQDLQSQGSVDVTINSTITLDLDDVVTASDRITGLTVTAQVTKKIVKISAGILTVDYEVGQSASTSGGISGSAESTPSGVSYIAGTGISISAQVISAEVTKADLDAVSKTATSAIGAVSNMSASIGALQETAETLETAISAVQSTADSGVGAANAAQSSADRAQETADTNAESIATVKTTADSAKSTAGTALQSITVTAPLSASKTGTTASLGIAAASQTAAGAMSAADKKKLDGIAENANAYTLPKASPTSLGGVKPDGRTITISADGTITAQSDDVAAAFLAAYPIGSTYKTISPTNPGTTYGGTWVEVDSLDYFTYERTA